MRELSVDYISYPPVVVAARVYELCAGRGFVHCEGRGRGVRVHWENLGEGVAHLQLAVEGLVEGCAHVCIEGAISLSVAGCWGKFVVCGVVGQSVGAHHKSKIGSRLFSHAFALKSLLLLRLNRLDEALLLPGPF